MLSSNEGCAGVGEGAPLARFTNGKNKESRITDVKVSNHKDKQVRYSFDNLFCLKKASWRKAKSRFHIANRISKSLSIDDPKHWEHSLFKSTELEWY